MTDARAHVALLVDFANLRQQLSSEGSGNGEEQQQDFRGVAKSLVGYARGIGRVGMARAYADWSREPALSRALGGTRLEPVLVPATEEGEDRSHIRLTVDAMTTLLNGDEPDAYVLVSSDPSLVPLVQALCRDGSEVTVVAGSEDAASELRAEADHFTTFEAVLGGAVAEPLVLRPTRDGGEEGRTARPSRGSKAAKSGERGGYYSNTPLLTESDFGDYDWTGFIQLIDELEQRLPFVGVRYLVNKVLGPHNCGIQDPRIKRDLINEAVDEGLIEMYAVGNVNERTDPVTACRLDRDNELVIEALGEDADGGFDPDGDDDEDDVASSEARADEFSTSRS